MHKKRNLLDYFSSPSKREKNNTPKSLSSDIIPDSEDFTFYSPDMTSDNNVINGKENKEVKLMNEELAIQEQRPMQLKDKIKNSEIGKSEIRKVKDEIKMDSSLTISESKLIDDNNNRKDKKEERYSFLVDIRDKNLKKPEDPDYDPTTLHIPEKFWKLFTPFERQFWEIKKKYFDSIVCFKKGKFYELYENDAEIGNRLFDLRLTDRVNMRMVGFPESSFDFWAGKFLEAGYRVARVEQAENMVAKGIREREGGRKEKIIGRELKEVVTTGTVYASEHIKTADAVYLAVMVKSVKGVSVLLYEASVNKAFLVSFGGDYMESLGTLLAKYEIREILSEMDEELRDKLHFKGPVVQPKSYPADNDLTKFSKVVKNHGESACIDVFVQYMAYLNRTYVIDSLQVDRLENISFPMRLCGTTLENLDILKNSHDGTENHTLLSAVDYTVTPMGKRLLKKWLLHPLTDKERIIERQRVAEKIHEIENTEEFRLHLRNFDDFERTLGRLRNMNVKVPDVSRVMNNIHAYSSFYSLMHKNSLLVLFGFPDLRVIIQEFSKAYVIDEKEIQPGNQNSEIVILQRKLDDIEAQLEEYRKEQRLVLRCEVSYKDIGKEIFQLEVPSNVTVPSSYYVVSTSKNTRRYYTEKLKALVQEYVEAQEMLFQANFRLVKEAANLINSYSEPLGKACEALALLDVFLSFNIFASIQNAVTPVFTDTFRLTECRNPIYASYVPNSISFDKNKILLLTGPNMGGKSTLLRTVALNVILAQTGMKVPCARYKAPIIDGIYTRIGARDDLRTGRSTFMVELDETSVILHRATSSSLVIIDELGRGTSTRDGECIAEAVLNHLKIIGPYVMFSTHYHRLALAMQDVQKGYMDVVVGDEIVFLYKLMEGVCCQSYGIDVAKLAGVPEEIIDEALRIRNELK